MNEERIVIHRDKTFLYRSQWYRIHDNPGGGLIIHRETDDSWLPYVWDSVASIRNHFNGHQQREVTHD